MSVRSLYNKCISENVFDAKRAAAYFFVSEFAYAGTTRYNSKNEFNVLYGGIGYNRKSLTDKIKFFGSVKNLFDKTIIHNLDFEEFLTQQNIKENDFIFLDPPYDSEFSTYDNNVFNKEDHIRLEKLLSSINTRWMMVIKNTDFIYDLYNNKGYYIKSFDKKYTINLNNKNNREVTHLIITSYDTVVNCSQKFVSL